MRGMEIQHAVDELLATVFHDSKFCNVSLYLVIYLLKAKEPKSLLTLPLVFYVFSYLNSWIKLH